MKMKIMQLKLENPNMENINGNFGVEIQSSKGTKDDSNVHKINESKHSFLILDSKGRVVQTHIKLTEDHYWDAFRVLTQHCIEDFGKDLTCSAIDHALYKNNLPSQPSEYCDEEEFI